MTKIKSSFKDGIPVFETTVPGVSMTKLRKFCEATSCKTSDYFERGAHMHYVPGVYLIAMFRHIVKKICKENHDFPVRKISSFYGHNGGTKENRVFINENLTYRLQVLSKDTEKILFRVEVTRSPEDIVLTGIFSFVF